MGVVVLKLWLFKSIYCALLWILNIFLWYIYMLNGKNVSIYWEMTRYYWMDSLAIDFNFRTTWIIYCSFYVFLSFFSWTSKYKRFIHFFGKIFVFLLGIKGYSYMVRKLEQIQSRILPSCSLSVYFLTNNSINTWA